MISVISVIGKEVLNVVVNVYGVKNIYKKKFEKNI